MPTKSLRNMTQGGTTEREQTLLPQDHLSIHLNLQSPNLHINILQTPRAKIRCPHCYRKGHGEGDCRDKKAGKPPSAASWVKEANCNKCNGKGHLAFDCPPKHPNRTYAARTFTPRASANAATEKQEIVEEEFLGYTAEVKSQKHWIFNKFFWFAQILASMCMGFPFLFSFANFIFATLLCIPIITFIHINAIKVHQACNIVQGDVQSLEDGWLMDSGATAHMTPHRNDCFNIIKSRAMVKLADGSTCTSEEEGQCLLDIQGSDGKQHKLLLMRVLIVPGLDRRLFSVPTFTEYEGNSINFQNNGITVKMGNVSMCVPTSKVGPLLAFHLSVANNASKLPRRCGTNLEVLHQRLGHRAITTILAASNNKIWGDQYAIAGSDQYCTSCKIACIRSNKKKNGPMTSAKGPKHRVFVDIIPNASQFGVTSGSIFPYFLLVVDQYSRFVWVEGMSNKSTASVIEALEKFTARYGRIKHMDSDRDEEGKIRSDAGTEFLSQGISRLVFIQPSQLLCCCS